jgi:hypothetical protein
MTTTTGVGARIERLLDAASSIATELRKHAAVSRVAVLGALARQAKKLHDLQGLASFMGPQDDWLIGNPDLSEEMNFDVLVRATRFAPKPIPHVDMAVWIWVSDMDDDRGLQRALEAGVAPFKSGGKHGIRPGTFTLCLYGAGSGSLLGTACPFGSCPIPGHADCAVLSCGAIPFVRPHRHLTSIPATLLRKHYLEI